jgi:hypothetical protein
MIAKDVAQRIMYRCTDRRCNFRWSVPGDYTPEQALSVSECVCGKPGEIVVKRTHKSRGVTCEK